MTINQTKDELSINEQLLFDIREVWNGEKMSMKFLCEKLTAIDDAIWQTYNNGQEITIHQLGKKLRQFGVIPQTIKTGANTTAKGYDKGQFLKIWERYLPPQINNNPFSP